MLTIDQFVQREVVQCVSSLVSLLATGYGNLDRAADLFNLAEQAFELASPIDDWEEAARQEGWVTQDFGTISRPAKPLDNLEGPGEYLAQMVFVESWQEACAHDDIEPYASEVFEHWSVTPWLAERLIAHGEKVDTDFAGMCVWARTTTGQQISADYVIGEIYRDLMAS